MKQGAGGFDRAAFAESGAFGYAAIQEVAEKRPSKCLTSPLSWGNPHRIPLHHLVQNILITKGTLTGIIDPFKANGRTAGRRRPMTDALPTPSWPRPYSTTSSR